MDVLRREFRFDDDDGKNTEIYLSFLLTKLIIAGNFGALLEILIFNFSPFSSWGEE